jgi:Na+/H+ antiporter NhaC
MLFVLVVVVVVIYTMTPHHSMGQFQEMFPHPFGNLYPLASGSTHHQNHDHVNDIIIIIINIIMVMLVRRHCIGEDCMK